MMPVGISIASALLVAVVLWRAWRSNRLTDTDTDLHLDSEMGDEEWAPCPHEFISSICNSEDWEFISKFDSEPLKALFLRERKSVACQWVRCTAASTRRIIREHAQLARRSKDLEIGPELRIYLRYAELQAACAVLLLGIGIFGPVRLRELSLYVSRLSEGFRHAHGSLRTALERKELQGI